VRYYLSENVWDAALNRIRYLFDEFPNVIACSSGGKDSTVVTNLCLIVAEEKGRLPLKVMFIDQEAEWQAVVDAQRTIMNDPRIEPKWYQMPIKIFNATSTTAPWLHCWEPGAEWIREKEPFAVTENIYGTDRFHDLFGAICKVEYPGVPTARVGGVRCEESPGRMLGLTTEATYKDVTWGAKDKTPDHYVFHPIYDWGLSDVWKAIHDNAWPYCRIYDYMYQRGVPLLNMRVSNIHHETAVKVLFYVQEIEAETWGKVCKRVPGINGVGQLQMGFYSPKELPPMFADWKEYRDYLLVNMVTDLSWRQKMARRFRSDDDRYVAEAQLGLTKTHIDTILCNDYEFTKLGSWAAKNGPFTKAYRMKHNGY
jgi:predicted phosphoadenosine phosphosulfate sulfurtransferase